MKKIVSTFRGKLVKMIRDAGSKFYDYSISPKIRQILLHLGYELRKKCFWLIDKLMNKNIRFKKIKKSIVNEKGERRKEKWDMRNEKWETRNENKIMN